jgi:2-polyprenyl-6-methoxyphenol hydroxylase-like FAD-dependent oxidoreductase
VVVGAGIAGMAAAAVVARHYDRVTVLERDHVLTGHRPGVPQSHHVDALLAAGLAALEQIFPGISSDLRQAGAPVFDQGTGVRFLLLGGYTPHAPTGVDITSASRPLLEAMLLGRLAELPQVTIACDWHVDGIIWTPDGSAAGVRGRASDGEESMLECDLVVVACGGSSRLSAWLTEGGYQTPPHRVVDARCGYGSRFYRVREGILEPGTFVTGQLVCAPDRSRGGSVFTVEDDMWLMSLVGANGDLPPREEDGFLRFAASLDNPDLQRIATSAEPLSDIHRYTNMANRWNMFGRLSRWPSGLIALGDAVCHLNPVYGQGMAVAAMEAVILHKTLSGTEPGWEKRFTREVTAFVRQPWAMASATDVPWVQSERPGLAARATSRLTRRLFRRIPDDPALYRTFARVQHMIASPILLAKPTHIASLVAHRPR